jgi:hypothetical protein
MLHLMGMGLQLASIQYSHTPSDGIAPNILILLHSSFCLLENKGAAAKPCQHTANGGSHFVLYISLVADDVGIPKFI